MSWCGSASVRTFLIDACACMSLTSRLIKFLRLLSIMVSAGPKTISWSPLLFGQRRSNQIVVGGKGAIAILQPAGADPDHSECLGTHFRMNSRPGGT